MLSQIHPLAMLGQQSPLHWNIVMWLTPLAAPCSVLTMQSHPSTWGGGISQMGLVFILKNPIDSGILAYNERDNYDTANTV